MDTTLIALGAFGFSVVCCIAAVLGLRKGIADMRELMEMRKEWQDREEVRIWEKLWALSRGMEELGMKYQPERKTAATYTKQ